MEKWKKILHITNYKLVIHTKVIKVIILVSFVYECCPLVNVIVLSRQGYIYIYIYVCVCMINNLTDFVKMYGP
jgi:hypothetical protein